MKGNAHEKALCPLLALISVILLPSCAIKRPDKTDLRVTSSSEKYTELLKTRAGGALSGDFILGTAGDAAGAGVDLSSFRDDGYVIRAYGGETVIYGKTETALDAAVRYYTNYCLNDDDVNVVYGEGYKVKALTIAGRDISEFSVYIPATRITAHNCGVRASEYIRQACGLYPRDCPRPAEHMISICSRMSGAHGNEDSQVPWITEICPSRAEFTAACIIRVYEFLESYIGWRFLADYDTTCAKKRTVITTDFPSG